MGAGQQGWQLAATLDRPENFWGLETCPEDWARLVEVHNDDPQTVRKMPARGGQSEKGARAQDRIRKKSDAIYRTRLARDRSRVCSASARGNHVSEGKDGTGGRQAQPL